MVIILISKKSFEYFDSQGHHTDWLKNNGIYYITADASNTRAVDGKGLAIYDYFYENQAWLQGQEISKNQIYSQNLKQDWNLPINKIQEIEKL